MLRMMTLINVLLRRAGQLQGVEAASRPGWQRLLCPGRALLRAAAVRFGRLYAGTVDKRVDCRHGLCMAAIGVALLGYEAPEGAPLEVQATALMSTMVLGWVGAPTS